LVSKNKYETKLLILNEQIQLLQYLPVKKNLLIIRNAPVCAGRDEVIHLERIKMNALTLKHGLV
jgi:hypothetical protein